MSGAHFVFADIIISEHSLLQGVRNQRSRSLAQADPQIPIDGTRLE